MTQSEEPAIPDLNVLPPKAPEKKKNSAAPASENSPKKLKALKKQSEENASDILEESFHILRMNPRRLLPLYYMGAFPFAITLLYFINDMSLGNPDRREIEIYALLLTVTFAWKNLTQSLFCLRIMNILNDRDDGPVGFARLARIFAFQNIVQPAGLIVQTVSAFLCFSLGWTTAFFNSFPVMAALEEDALPELIKDTWHLSFLNPKQNHLLLLLFSFLGLVVSLNIAITLIVLPYLAKIFFGIETMFSAASGTMLVLKIIFNITYWSIVLTCAWLLLDPITKAAYTVRVFYGESESRGYDILAKLSMLVRNAKNTKKLFILFLVFQGFYFIGGIASAGERPDPEKLANAIEETLKEREYKWKIPQPPVKKPQEESFIVETIEAMFKQAGEWIKDMISFFEKFIPENRRSMVDSSGTALSFLKDASVLTSIIILLLVGAICSVMIIRMRRKRAFAEAQAFSFEIKAVPDLTDENTSAEELEKSAWLEMASRLFEEGNFRLAVRAVFFAELSLLSDEKLLSRAKFKTNREYLFELKRRAHSRNGLVDAFDASLRIYERAWYGDYETTPDIYALIRDDFMKIRGDEVS